MAFQKATKKQARLRLALIGPSGSGKTYTALRTATALGKRVAVIDSERGSASKYASLFDFDTMDLEHFAPKSYVAAINEAEKAGYDVLVIDSLSHAWMGKGGALEMVDAAAARNRGDKFSGWRDVTPEHNALVDALVRCKCHVVVTMRAKTEYVMEKDERGKTSIKKMGLAPVQRDGVEYEFDVVGDMDNAKLVVSKTRCPALKDAVINEPGEGFAKTLREWLTDGAPAPSPAEAPTEGRKAAPRQESAREVPAPETRPEVERVRKAVGGEVEAVVSKSDEPPQPKVLAPGPVRGRIISGLTEKGVRQALEDTQKVLTDESARPSWLAFERQRTLLLARLDEVTQPLEPGHAG